MTTPTTPRRIAALDVPLAVVEAQTVDPVAACHDAEMAADHPELAHLLDALDDGRLYRFAPGYPTTGGAA